MNKLQAEPGVESAPRRGTARHGTARHGTAALGTRLNRPRKRSARSARV